MIVKEKTAIHKVNSESSFILLLFFAEKTKQFTKQVISWGKKKQEQIHCLA